MAGSASCDNVDYKCDEINGHAYWTVTQMDQTGGCSDVKCVAESDLNYQLERSHSCGPCKSCLTEHRCDVTNSNVKYSFYRFRDDGSCEEKCENGDKFADMMSHSYSCGFCPDDPLDLSTRSTCKGTTDSTTTDTTTTTVPAGPLPPSPDKCVLKRASRIMRYKTDWPDLKAGITIQVMAGAPECTTCNIYNYTVTDPDVQEFPIDNATVFEDLYNADLNKNDQSVSLRFVSQNGPGDWNSCSYSPIAIDLNNDGVVGKIEPADVGRTEGWEIDITGDGGLEYLNQWFAPEAGILVDFSGKFYDEEVENGIITGAHLLGDMGGAYEDGFDKLKKHDLDCNGIIEGKELKGFYIWTDFNSNAILDDGELSKLKDHEIIGFHTKHDDNLVSSAILLNSTEIMTQDLWFYRR